MLLILAHDRWEQAMPSRMPTADAGSPSQADSRQCALYTDSPLTKLGCRKGLGLKTVPATNATLVCFVAEEKRTQHILVIYWPPLGQAQYFVPVLL